MKDERRDHQRESAYKENNLGTGGEVDLFGGSMVK